MRRKEIGNSAEDKLDIAAESMSSQANEIQTRPTYDVRQAMGIHTEHEIDYFSCLAHEARKVVTLCKALSFSGG